MQALFWVVTHQLKTSYFQRKAKSKHWGTTGSLWHRFGRLPSPRFGYRQQGLGSPLLPRSLGLSSVKWAVRPCGLCCG